jgi:hypothetical protein
MLPGPDILPLLDLSNAVEVVLRDGGSPAGMTSFAPGAATYNKGLSQFLLFHVSYPLINRAHCYILLLLLTFTFKLLHLFSTDT